MTLRNKAALLLEPGLSIDSKGRLLNLALIILIILNVIAITLESVKSLHVVYHRQFLYFEFFSIFVFSIEYVARVWSCIDAPEARDRDPITGRLRYMLTPIAVIDLVAILPFYLGLFLSFDLRFLRVLRLLRLFKLSRYSPALDALLDVIQRESGALISALVVLMMMLVISASGIHLIEGDIQPEAFGSIPDAMWWAIITLTTVGYGDVAPITPLGKLFGGFIGLIGIGMVAMPAAILATGFAQNISLRKKKYNKFITHILRDGHIDEHERWALEQMRKELGLAPDDALQLMDRVLRNKKDNEETVCPHCGEPLEIKNRPVKKTE